MKIYQNVVLAISVILLSGCVTIPQVQLKEHADAVKVAKADPANNYKELGPISASDGDGCGGFGFQGTYERAVILLKNKAYEMGGDFVQIYSMVEPHLVPGCFVNQYTINGTLFKKTADNPSSLQVIDSTPKKGSDKLRELKKLLDEKIITQDEYDSQKKKILEVGL